jgi:hypothetical protein
LPLTLDDDRLLILLLDDFEEGAVEDDELGTLLEAAPHDFTSSQAVCQCAPVPGA